MKVMGSATMVFQAIVIGLTIPVAVANYGVTVNTAIWVAAIFIVICFLAVGGIRRDRRTAIITGSLVQVLVLISAIWVRPMLFPGIVFTAIWLLAIKLSAKTPA